MSRKRQRWSLALALAVLALLSTTSVAGAQDAVIQGIVRDPSGAALPGVAVGLRRNGRTIRSELTDREGRFAFPLDLDPRGKYQLRLTLTGVATAVVPIARESVSIRTSTAGFTVEAVVRIESVDSKVKHEGSLRGLLTWVPHKASHGFLTRVTQSL